MAGVVMPDVISIADTTREWASQRQIPFHYESETGSTNEDAKNQALVETDPLCLYLADHQTHGRGRGINSWQDTGSGESLLSTWSCSLTAAPQPIAAPRIGLALFDAISSVWPSLPWSLKAPNDIYLQGSKCGGILLETVSAGSQYRLLIGFGLNILNHPRRYQEATHLTEVLHRHPNEGEWFQFLDETSSRLTAALPECSLAELKPEACQELLSALNANTAKSNPYTQITPQGDLLFSGGRIRWFDL